FRRSRFVDLRCLRSPPALADPDRLLVLADPDRLLLLFRRAVPPDPAVLVGPNRQRVGKSPAPLFRLPSFLPFRLIRFGFSSLVNIHRQLGDIALLLLQQRRKRPNIVPAALARSKSCNALNGPYVPFDFFFVPFFFFAITLLLGLDE